MSDFSDTGFSTAFPGLGRNRRPVAAPPRVSRRAMAARALRGHAEAMPAPAPGRAALFLPRAAQRLLSMQAAAVLWVEFAALYIAMPLMLAFALKPSAMWPMLFGSLAFALLILERMPGFTWRRRLCMPRAKDWAFCTLIVGGAAGLALLAVLFLHPDRLLAMPREAPGVWLIVALVYPSLSVLPQEVIWRTLFFERYGALFPNQAAAALVNGAAFGLAHLFYWNWPAVAFATLGGFFFALAYQRAGRRRAFILVCVAHALAGLAIFSLGLHEQFTHGAVGR